MHGECVGSGERWGAASCGGVTASVLADQSMHLVRDVGRQLLVLGAGELVEEGELPRAEEDLKKGAHGNG